MDRKEQLNCEVYFGEVYELVVTRINKPYSDCYNMTVVKIMLYSWRRFRKMAQELFAGLQLR